MKGLFRSKTLFFAALAVTLGATTGVVLAAHAVTTSPVGTITGTFSGHEGQSGTGSSGEAQSPEPEATENPEASPEPEATESPEATEAAENEPNEEASPEPQEHPSPTPTSTTTVSSRTFNLTGGTVTLSCPSSGAIMLDSATPNVGFSFEQSREDGDQTIEIRFQSSSHESRLQADCAGGQVQVLELREESN